MIPDESELKKRLRTELRSRVRLISPESRKLDSQKAAALLEQQDVWQQSKAILFYAPLTDELDILPLMIDAQKAGKTIVLPRFDPKTECYTICEIKDLHRDVAPAKFGILEPHGDQIAFPGKHLDFALVPGVGFDPIGARLGRGRGFYDRLLAQISGIKCGIAFDEQIVPQIPTAPHDIKMNFILTPTRWLVASCE